MIGISLRMVYSRRAYTCLALLLFPSMLVFYAWAGQVLIIDAGGVSVLLEPEILAAAAVLSALFAIAIPVQLYALRVALVSARQTGSTILGALVGTVSMSCCAPVILPGLLSLIGLSGTTILLVNLAVHRYFVPLALAGIVLLGYSLFSTASSLGGTCVIDPARVGWSGGSLEEER